MCPKHYALSVRVHDAGLIEGLSSDEIHLEKISREHSISSFTPQRQKPLDFNRGICLDLLNSDACIREQHDKSDIDET